MANALLRQRLDAGKDVDAMYDAQKAAHLAQLESAYNQNMSDAQSAYDKINPAYQQRANDLAVQYERNRRNANIQAAGNGLNTGTASQMALAQNSAFQRDYGGLRVAQQGALDEAQRGINDLTRTYNSDVVAYTAQNDFERAAAKREAEQQAYQRQLQLAANLAKYGDFSGYAGIYSHDQRVKMKQQWIAQNPDMAYRTGNLSAEKYRQMTGKYPQGYSAKSSGGGKGGGAGGGGGGSTATVNNTAPSRGQVARDAQAALRNGEINRAEYDALIRGLH